MLLKLRMESEELDTFPGVVKGQEDVPHNVTIDKKGKEKPVKAIPESWYDELPEVGGWLCVYNGANKTKPWSKLRIDVANRYVALQTPPSVSFGAECQRSMPQCLRDHDTSVPLLCKMFSDFEKTVWLQLGMGIPAGDCNHSI